MVEIHSRIIFLQSNTVPFSIPPGICVQCVYMMMKTGMIASGLETNTDFLPAAYVKHLNLPGNKRSFAEDKPVSISAASDLQ